MFIGLNHALLALVLFMFASFTDYLDGYFARKTNTVSVIGEVIDPIADKILIVFIFYGLAVNLDSYFNSFCGIGNCCARNLGWCPKRP